MDQVTSLGTAGNKVDGSVRRLETAYDSAGRPWKFTSYTAPTGGLVYNQVERTYNGLGQLTKEAQATVGSVTVNTLGVQYDYSEMAGGANHSRPTTLTYPDGRVVGYGYATGFRGDGISRVTSMADGLLIENYAHLGLGTVVARTYGSNTLRQNYVALAGETGDGGDQYTGLDRFGRVVRQRWLNAASQAVDDYAYGYDQGGNRLYRENKLASTFSELYHANGSGQGYDALGQLQAYSRGTLNTAKDAIATPTRSQSWTIDAMGNFSQVLTTNGGATTTDTRSHDGQNRLTEVTGASGQVALTYDDAGNMLTDQSANEFTYDAWNRLTKWNSSTLYRHDALGRRSRVVQTNADGTAANRDSYYSADWQLLEERGVLFDPSRYQYVWSPLYVDGLVTRYRDAAGDGTYEEQLFALTDANWNVTGVVDVATGAVVERYAYDPYGRFEVYTADWSQQRSASAYQWDYFHQGGRYQYQTALYHFRNRDYSPTLMRWVSQDPIGFGGGDSNLYRYVANSPANWLDPSGLQIVLTPPVGPPSRMDGTFTPDFTPFPMQPPASAMPPAPAEPPCPDGTLGLVGEIAGFVVGIFVEPVDWFMTGREIYNNPGSWTSYVGLLPFIPAAAGRVTKGVGRTSKVVSHIDDVPDEVVEAAIKSVPTHYAPIPGRPFKGPNAPQQAFQHLKDFHGVDIIDASHRLHVIKTKNGLGAADNVIFGKTGDVYHPVTGELLGSLTDKALGKAPGRKP
jgi:RHS repeat-associated protein